MTLEIVRSRFSLEPDLSDAKKDPSALTMTSTRRPGNMELECGKDEPRYAPSRLGSGSTDSSVPVPMCSLGSNSNDGSNFDKASCTRSLSGKHPSRRTTSSTMAPRDIPSEDEADEASQLSSRKGSGPLQPSSVLMYLSQRQWERSLNRLASERNDTDCDSELESIVSPEDLCVLAPYA